jgi:hypothetical protein
MGETARTWHLVDSSHDQRSEIIDPEPHTCSATFQRELASLFMWCLVDVTT